MRRNVAMLRSIFPIKNLNNTMRPTNHMKKRVEFKTKTPFKSICNIKYFAHRKPLPYYL